MLCAGAVGSADGGPPEARGGLWRQGTSSVYLQARFPGRGPRSEHPQRDSGFLHKLGMPPQRFLPHLGSPGSCRSGS